MHARPIRTSAGRSARLRRPPAAPAPPRPYFLAHNLNPPIPAFHPMLAPVPPPPCPSSPLCLPPPAREDRQAGSCTAGRLALSFLVPAPPPLRILFPPLPRPCTPALPALHSRHDVIPGERRAWVAELRDAVPLAETCRLHGGTGTPAAHGAQARGPLRRTAYCRSPCMRDTSEPTVPPTAPRRLPSTPPLPPPAASACSASRRAWAGMPISV